MRGTLTPTNLFFAINVYKLDRRHKSQSKNSLIGNEILPTRTELQISNIILKNN
ncbi:hypothetical protein C8D84_11163 [Psychrobacter immobilis]|uniref:Uncharacterized protein n=1 Tax=Psychrobacter immobilis TaxID=498 RepID=A0A2V1ZVH3_PSYIM|nr:hypothetical protein C8D84_11163 [Psychrobacter immobilis]